MRYYVIVRDKTEYSHQALGVLALYWLIIIR